MDQNKEKEHGNISTLTLLFLERCGSVLRMDEADKPLGGSSSLFVHRLRLTLVTVFDLMHVTHNPPRNRQEAAAEYFLFLPSCRRQTGATL